MALKFQISKDDHAKLDDSVKGLYSEKDGKFQLAIDGLPDTAELDGLKRKVEELLSEKKDAAKRAKEAEDAARAAQEEAARKSGDVTALENSWKEKLAKREKELLDEIDSLKGSINGMLVDNVATKLATEMAVQGSADILIPHIKSRLAAEQKDGKFVTVIRDKEGKPSAATLDELKNEFVANPAFAPVIVGSKATGGGANGGNHGGGAAKTVTRTQFDGMNQVQRAEFAKSGGQVTD